MEVPGASMPATFKQLVGPTVRAMVKERRSLAQVRRGFRDGMVSQSQAVFTVRAIHHQLDDLDRSASLVLPAAAMTAMRTELSAIDDATIEESQVADVLASLWNAMEIEQARELQIQLWRMDSQAAQRRKTLADE